MARTSTGTPPGRPKTYLSDDERPVSLSVRLPRPLFERIERFARLHRQSISELVRDGLEWRLDQDDPRWQALSDNEHYSNAATDTETREAPEHLIFLAELRTALAHQNAQLRQVLQALAHHPTVLSSGEHYSNTTDAPPNQPAPPMKAAEQTPPESHKQSSNTVLQKNASAFDSTKYVLGKLCPRGHDYQGTGHSLLRLTNRHCLVCDREKFRERKQAKREELTVMPRGAISLPRQRQAP